MKIQNLIKNVEGDQIQFLSIDIIMCKVYVCKVL